MSASIISRFGLRFVGTSVASSAASGDGPLGAGSATLVLTGLPRRKHRLDSFKPATSYRRSCSLLLSPSSAQHPATSLAPQPQWLSSASPPPQPLEQRRIRHRPGMAADTLELRLAALLHIRCARSTRRTPSHRPGVARERVHHRLVLCRRRHRCPSVLKHRYPVAAAWMHLEGSAVGTLRPGRGGARLHAPR